VVSVSTPINKEIVVVIKFHASQCAANRRVIGKTKPVNFNVGVVDWLAE
jgi:phage host-nuclease inhibitor protein Gam